MSIFRGLGEKVSRALLTENQIIIRELAEVMDTVPSRLESSYLGKAERTAALLGNPVTQAGASSPFKPLGQTAPNISTLSIPVIGPEGQADDPQFRSRVMAARNNVVAVIDAVSSFASRALMAGFAPPSNPFVVVNELNSARTDRNAPISPDASLCDDLVLNIGAYVDLLKAEHDGRLNLDLPETVAQLSSVGMSFEGFGGTGNNAADLMRFLPDIDALKAKKARDALAALDFKKRTPQVLFTMNYSPDGQLLGSIVGWKKMPDASGYVIRRRDLFTGAEVSKAYSNEEVFAIYDGIKDYVTVWGSSFYGSLEPSAVLAVTDASIKRDSFYVYTVQGYQTSSPADGSLFVVETSPLSLSPSERQKLKDDFEALDKTSDRDVISPWPIIAERILGDQSYDWILAAVNIRASISRRDSRTVTRSYSYLAAQLDFIFKQMDAGKFLVPQDVDQVVKSVQQSIVKYGITQVIQEVLQETGILYHFDGKDVPVDTHFYRVGSVTPSTSNLVAVVAAAIDPETATLDLRKLSSNISILLRSTSPLGNGTVLAPGVNPLTSARPGEVDPPQANVVSQDLSEDEVQFLNSIKIPQVDLTTFDGISQMVRTIRLFSDFRGQVGQGSSFLVSSSSNFVDSAPVTTVDLLNRLPGVKVI